jgi:hypothetical protein
MGRAGANQIAAKAAFGAATTPVCDKVLTRAFRPDRFGRLNLRPRPNLDA